MRRVALDVYFDVTCPYCYIGAALVERLEKETPITVCWKPVSFAPQVRADGAPWKLTVGEMGSFQRQVAKYGRKWGLEVTVPSFQTNSVRAHLALEFARDQGCLPEVQQRVFAAYFDDCRNVGDLDVICSLAEECGLEAPVLKEHFQSGHLQRTYVPRLEQFSKELRALRATGVPAFVIGRYRLYSLPDYETLQRAILRAVSDSGHTP